MTKSSIVKQTVYRGGGGGVMSDDERRRKGKDLRDHERITWLDFRLNLLLLHASCSCLTPDISKGGFLDINDAPIVTRVTASFEEEYFRISGAF